MTAFYTDDQGRVRVIPDGEPQENKSPKNRLLASKLKTHKPAPQSMKSMEPVPIQESDTQAEPYESQLDKHGNWVFKTKIEKNVVVGEANTTPQEQGHYQRKTFDLPDIKVYELTEYPKSYELKPKQYPDVTKTVDAYVNAILKQVPQNIAVFTSKHAAKLAPGGKWDLKGQPGIPPAGHWAIYKGEKVTDAFIANYAYGQAMAKAGYPLKTSLNIGDAVYILPKGHIFGQSHDQVEDQAAIVSGWCAYHSNNPWLKNLSTPDEYEFLKDNYPKEYQKLRHQNYYERN